MTTGDLDGDGRLDIIASNWGETPSMNDGENRPLRIYYGDLHDRGEVSLIESVYEPLGE